MISDDERFQLILNSDQNDLRYYFESPFHHYHKLTANQKFQWFATDQQENINREYREIDKIVYEFNSFGYRCDELTKSDLMFVGCSFTFGVGLPKQDVWSYLLAKEFDQPYINLSYPGGSLSYIQRTILKCFDVVMPRKIFVLIPYNYRFEFISTENPDFIKVWSKSGLSHKNFFGKDKERIYAYEIFTTKKNEEFEFLKSLFFINSYIKARGCQLFWTEWQYDELPTAYFESEKTKTIYGNYIESSVFNRHKRHESLSLKARDGIHPSSQFHRQYYQEVKKYV